MPQFAHVSFDTRSFAVFNTTSDGVKEFATLVQKTIAKHFNLIENDKPATEAVKVTFTEMGPFDLSLADVTVKILVLVGLSTSCLITLERYELVRDDLSNWNGWKSDVTFMFILETVKSTDSLYSSR